MWSVMLYWFAAVWTFIATHLLIVVPILVVALTAGVVSDIRATRKGQS